MRARRTLLAAVLVAVCALAGAEALAQQKTRAVIHKRHVCTATTSQVVEATSNRRELTLLNEGTITAYFGGSHTGAAVVRALHAGSSLTYENFEAGLVCNTAGDVSGTGTTSIGVEEEMK